MENENSITDVGIKSEINVYAGASILKITVEEQAKIQSSFEAKEIEIRPDGLIYLPQTFWRKRLNDSFGIGQWCLIVKSSTKDPQKSKLYLQGILMVRGSYISEAVGEAEYHETNDNQSWASVWESAKSDCITRCCKDLGIASELWQPEFIQKWINENAVMVWLEIKQQQGETKKKKAWRKKTSPPFWNESNNKGTEQRKTDITTANESKTDLKWLNPNTVEWHEAIKFLVAGNKIDLIEKKYKLSKENRTLLLSQSV